MIKRQLGNTGIWVSEIAFGTVELGIPYGIGVENESQMLDEAAAIDLLQSALENGVNFFDTARQYGKSEALLGKAFKDKRTQVIIATKCAHLRKAGGILPEANELEIVMENSLKESLQQLQTSYIDVFMLHDGDVEIMKHPVVKKTMERFKKEGWIKAAGVSTYTPEETTVAMNNKIWDVVQVPFNLMDQRQASLFGQLAQRGVGIIVRSVLLKGLLSDRGKGLHPALKAVEAHIALYDELIKTSGFTLPELATKFALSFPQVAAVLVGIDKMKYLQTALSTADGRYLDESLFNKAKGTAFKDPDFLNLHHWSVKGWLK